MMISYKKLPMYQGEENKSILRSDGACIPFDEVNTDYQEYLAWLAEGNEPLLADEVVL
jgi:hypothetical protein